jgi:hypothetical protein
MRGLIQFTAILIAAGAIDNADIRPDETANVITGDRRLCFGPCDRDGNGRVIDPPEDWDATEYVRDEDGWRETSYTYAKTDDEMVEFAETYAPAT